MFYNINSVDAKHQAQDADRFLAFTTPFNFSGQPTLSLPLGFDQQGCPMGLQLVASLYQEQNLLALGRLYQLASPWLNQHPVI